MRERWMLVAAVLLLQGCASIGENIGSKLGTGLQEIASIIPMVPGVDGVKEHRIEIEAVESGTYKAVTGAFALIDDADARRYEVLCEPKCGAITVDSLQKVLSLRAVDSEGADLGPVQMRDRLDGDGWRAIIMVPVP